MSAGLDQDPAGPLLLAAAVFPPAVTGSAILSRNLWAEWPAGDLVVVTRQSKEFRIDPALRLDGVPVHLIDPSPFSQSRWSTHLEPFAALAVTRKLLAVAREVRPRAIWANYPYSSFAIGAWRAARRLKLPFLLHLHDTWGESVGSRPVERLAAWFYEARLARGATRLFAITSEAREYFRGKHQVDSYVLAHSIPAADLAQPEPAMEPPRPVVHFAGAIYPLMNLDAVVNLAQCLDHSRTRVSFECYTPNAVAELARAGITGPRVQLQFAPKSEVMKAQRTAAVVFLPLAFHSTNPVEVRTVFPTKLLEYLVCGRPILVHAPADSWVARDARAKGWGEVVDRLDPQALAGVLDDLLGNERRQRELVTGALAEARRRAAPQVAADLRTELRRLLRHEAAGSWQSRTARVSGSRIGG